MSGNAKGTLGAQICSFSSVYVEEIRIWRFRNPRSGSLSKALTRDGSNLLNLIASRIPPGRIVVVA